LCSTADHGRRRRGVIRTGRGSGIAVRLRLQCRRLAFRTDVAAIDRQRALRVDADEDAGARNVSRRIGHRTIVERGERVLDLAQPLIHLVRQFASLGIVGFELGVFGVERRDGRLFVLRESGGDALQPAQPAIVAVGEIDRDLDPLPALGGDDLGLGLQLLGDHTIEQSDIFEPAAIVGLEQVSQHDAARSLIGVETDEHRPAIGGADGLFREHTTDLVGLLRPGAGDRPPNLLLACVVGGDGEGRQLLEGHAVLGVNVEQRRRDRRQSQALLHDVHADEERRGDVLLGASLLAQGLEGAELVERMQRRTLDVLGQRIVLAEYVGARIADHARNRRGLRQPLLLHQQLERPVAAAAGRNLEHAGLGARGVEDRTNVEALKQRAPADVLGQLLDRDAGLHAPDVGLAQHQLVERNVARGR
jgi:hypothetical protein